MMAHYTLVGDDGHGNYTEIAEDPRLRSVRGFCRSLQLPMREYDYLEVQVRDEAGDDEYDIIDSWSNPSAG